ncbi:MAG: hypothetical protein JWQ57_3277 [Mucilaginibacter sp.]|nr:hypothetical protein [Mucilaginibacter sp.]
MACKHLFVDSDVLLDLALLREPFYPYIQLLLHEGEEQNVKLSTSGLIIANMNYILSKQLGALKAREALKALRMLIGVLSFDAEIIDLALASDFTDFEDDIQYYIAQKHNCDAIITRNIKDYKNSTIPVLTAEQFLNTL